MKAVSSEPLPLAMIAKIPISKETRVSGIASIAARPLPQIALATALVIANAIEKIARAKRPIDAACDCENVMNSPTARLTAALSALVCLMLLLLHIFEFRELS
jgi:hypothetical protein